MAQERMPLTSQQFVDDIIKAAKEGDLTLFSNKFKPQVDSQYLNALFNYVDEKGNTVFHFLLAERYGWLSSKKKRQAKTEIWDQLMQIPSCKVALNRKDQEGVTPLRLAIILSDQSHVEKMIESGADITQTTIAGISILELAVKHKKTDIYEFLLKKHNKADGKKESPVFTTNQIERSKQALQKDLKVKQARMGVLGTLLAIACPVGAILAFYELPLLEIMFAALIPVGGPIIGLIGAAVIGGLLFWSMYHKAAMKHGAYAQEMVQLNATQAKLNGLHLELNSINKRLAQPCLHSKDKATYQTEKLQIEKKLNDIYSKVDRVADEHKGRVEDWATKGDVFRAKMLTFGSFLCSFSGILGVLGGASSFLPAALVATTVLAGVPVFGWIALGIAATVAIGVSAWYYHYKYPDKLKECGKDRKEMHDAKVALSKSRDTYEATKKQSLEAKPVARPVTDVALVTEVAPKIELKQDSPASLLAKVGFHSTAQQPCGQEANMGERKVPTLTQSVDMW